ncbi:MAG TPA: NYN domain-containing protein [Candidatus Paceibacterota bacterium]|nr:NYN domain-containing protein [Candidatus Paceibacterota bacterium]
MNICFIDGQNLHLGTAENGWKIDYRKFRKYLNRKYNVYEIYYFIGYFSTKYQNIYTKLQNAGFIIIFKENNKDSMGKKKGNIDTDMVFEIMKNIIDNKNLEKIVIVSGDGDYKKLVTYLISKDKFYKILFPNKKFSSSLYKSLGTKYFDQLDNINIKSKIILK